MRLVFRLGFLILAIGLASLAIGYRWLDVRMNTVMPLQEPLKIHLEKGQSIYHVARELVAAKAIDRVRPFVWYARYQDVAHKIKAGEYLFQPGLTPHQLLQELVAGNVVQYSVTLVEGLTFKEFVATLSASKSLRPENAETPLNPEKLLAELGIEEAHPEGLFSPDTYFFTKGETAVSLLKRAYERQQKILAEEWAGRAKDLPYETPYEALIMASIVEKETGVESERADIAGVFVRRLQKKMRLQTDPTVIYGLGDSYQGNITRKHLKQKTAYNTYVIKGLPPTPIANPGREAIHAALHPADGKTLYFVAKGDGSHVFSETLAEHNNAVRKYQLQRRKDYRSAPKTK